MTTEIRLSYVIAELIKTQLSVTGLTNELPLEAAPSACWQVICASYGIPPESSMFIWEKTLRYAQQQMADLRMAQAAFVNGDMSVGKN